MIISSWNVNSVRARIENIKSYLLKYKPDIVMMQEIKTEDINFPYDEFSSMDYESHVFGQKSYNGVAIISKHKLKNIRTDLIKDKLKHLDEVTLMEVLEITSDDLVERFVDRIEQQQDALEIDLDESTPWDND